MSILGSQELNFFKVKETLHSLFPELWKVPEEFEAIWSDCVDAIGQGCKASSKKLIKSIVY